MPSRHRRDSCPSQHEVDGFFFDFEAFRTELTEMLRAGVLSRLFRELNEPLPKAKEGKEMRWIIYDGDVDAVCHCVEINAVI